MPTGTPRGFNLSNMPFGFGSIPPGFGGMPPTGGSTVGFPPMMGMHGVQNAGQWNAGAIQGNSIDVNAMGGVMGMGMMHNPGAIRRGGNRYNNNRSNPYDRRGGGGQRYNNQGPIGAANGSPPRDGMNLMGMMGGGPGIVMGGPGGMRMPSGGGGGKWGDGAGGGMTMGPREAVQGRSLKSYEDLDAASGGDGGGELNY